MWDIFTATSVFSYNRRMDQLFPLASINSNCLCAHVFNCLHLNRNNLLLAANSRLLPVCTPFHRNRWLITHFIYDSVGYKWNSLPSSWMSLDSDSFYFNFFSLLLDSGWLLWNVFIGQYYFCHKTTTLQIKSFPAHFTL